MQTTTKLAHSLTSKREFVWYPHEPHCGHILKTVVLLLEILVVGEWGEAYFIVCCCVRHALRYCVRIEAQRSNHYCFKALSFEAASI